MNIRPIPHAERPAFPAQKSRSPPHGVGALVLEDFLDQDSAQFEEETFWRCLKCGRELTVAPVAYTLSSEDTQKYLGSEKRLLPPALTLPLIRILPLTRMTPVVLTTMLAPMFQTVDTGDRLSWGHW
ncbi:hypothetical protein E4U28_002608 [Claviceps purpurea]|nr:hypothetical protein E4U28_002608 [Claviceps purpurea]